jgi:hypothetical protein
MGSQAAALFLEFSTGDNKFECVGVAKRAGPIRSIRKNQQER